MYDLRNRVKYILQIIYINPYIYTCMTHFNMYRTKVYQLKRGLYAHDDLWPMTLALLQTRRRTKVDQSVRLVVILICKRYVTQTLTSPFSHIHIFPFVRATRTFTGTSVV